MEPAQSKRGRWRCKDCGSTRIRGIVAAYCDGRLDRDSVHPRVSDGDFVIHMEIDVDPASIVCENCGSPRARFEREAVPCAA